MTRAALIVTVAFAAYAAISSVLALLVGVAWRAGYLTRTQADPAGKANRLVALRITPSLLGFLLSAGVVLPVYLAFEPIRDYELVGPIPIVLAAIGVMVVFASSCVAARTAFLTRRIKQQWLHSATALEIGPAGVPAYVVDAPSPMVALVGVFSPRLIAARTVIDACSAEELAAIVAHERGHLHARDNFKRWLLTCAPDVMRWTRLHESIVGAWRDAAEFAADDAATRGKEEARVDLAALLLKIARLAPPRFATPAGVSTFADKEGLDRRVRRLLTPSHEQLRASWQLLAPAVLGITLLAVIVAVTSPSDLKEIYEIVELGVAFGR